MKTTFRAGLPLEGREFCLSGHFFQFPVGDHVIRLAIPQVTQFGRVIGFRSAARTTAPICRDVFLPIRLDRDVVDTGLAMDLDDLQNWYDLDFGGGQASFTLL